MASITVSASALKTVYYRSSVIWRDGDLAYQGMYSGTKTRVGVIDLNGLGNTLRSANINSITLNVDISGGTNSDDRTITFYTSNIQGVNTSYNGQQYLGTLMGTIVGETADNESTGGGQHTYTLNSTTNSALFAAMAAYLREGNTTLLLYNGEDELYGTLSYSKNYLAFKTCSITVEYDGIYTITYDANGQGTAPAAVEVQGGDSITLPAMSATGYNFGGWALTPDATSGMTGTYTPVASVILYAVWQLEGSYMYYNNGGAAVKCEVYYNDGGIARKCSVYYNDNGTAVSM